jgi:hypothetical protein
MHKTTYVLIVDIYSGFLTNNIVIIKNINLAFNESFVALLLALIQHALISSTRLADITTYYDSYLIRELLIKFKSIKIK